VIDAGAYLADYVRVPTANFDCDDNDMSIIAAIEATKASCPLIKW